MLIDWCPGAAFARTANEGPHSLVPAPVPAANGRLDYELGDEPVVCIPFMRSANSQGQ